MTPELLTVEEVAARLKLTERTVRTMINRGEIPAIRVSRLWRVDVNDLQNWLDSLKGNAAHEPA